MPVKFNIQIEICARQVALLLCAAFEGGIRYWATVEEYIEPEPALLESHLEGMGGSVYAYADYPLTPGGAVIISDRGQHERAYDDAGQPRDPPGMRTARIDLETIQLGLTLFATKYPLHYAAWLNESFDATTGDVFVQLCAFGAVIYG